MKKSLINGYQRWVFFDCLRVMFRSTIVLLLILVFFRLYHYSNTNLPQPPFAINQPAAEDMVDQPWLITRICRMIDEFSDVNEGEKEFIKMWNIHVQHFT